MPHQTASNYWKVSAHFYTCTAKEERQIIIDYYSFFKIADCLVSGQYKLTWFPQLWRPLNGWYCIGRCTGINAELASPRICWRPGKGSAYVAFAEHTSQVWSFFQYLRTIRMGLYKQNTTHFIWVEKWFFLTCKSHYFNNVMILDVMADDLLLLVSGKLPEKKWR